MKTQQNSNSDLKLSQRTKSNNPNHTNKLPVQDGFATSHFIRIIKGLEFSFLYFNLLGFLLIFLYRVFGLFQNKINMCFTYLVLVQLFLECVIIYYRKELYQQQKDAVRSRKIKKKQNSNKNISQIEESGKENIIQIKKILMDFISIHTFFILAQPNILLSDQLNTFLLNISTIRLYTLIRFYYMNKQKNRSRFQRIVDSFGLDINTMNYKIGFSSIFFTSSALALLFFIFIGLGNAIYYQQNSDKLQQFLDVSYYLIITLSTVGYGDIVVSKSESKLLVCVVIIIGIFLTSLTVVYLLKQFTFSKTQQNAYFLRQKLILAQQEKNYVIDKLVLLLDMDRMQKQLFNLMSEQQKNKAEYFEAQFRERLDTVQSNCDEVNQNEGDVKQAVFERLINNLNNEMKKQIKLNKKYQRVIKQYNKQNGTLDELRSKMQFLKQINPVSGFSMENQINKITYKIRGIKLKNMVMNQLYQTSQ